MKYAITSEDLKRLLDEKIPVKIFDVRLLKDRTPVEHPVAGALRRNPDRVTEWQTEFSPQDIVVVFCVHGRQVSQAACEALRERCIHARHLDGGLEAWVEHLRSGAG